MRPQKICFALSLLLVSALFLFRLLHLPHAPFLNDEPRLLALVENTYQAQQWPVVGPVGSQPIPYGPIPHWFYQTVRHFSGAPMAAHWAHGLVFLAAHLLLGYLVWLSLGARAAILFLLLVASSPWLFIYSQMPWEVLLQVVGSALAVAALVRFARRPSPWVPALLWGIGLAICLGTHLMGVSLLAASWLMVAWLAGRKWQRHHFIFLALGSATTLLLLSPYLYAIVSGEFTGAANPVERWGNGRHFWWNLVKTSIYLSPWQMKYFLEPQEDLFFAYLGPWLHKFFYLDIFGWLAKFFVWGMAGRIFYLCVKGREVPPLAWLAAVGVALHALQLQYLNLVTYPHYFLPFWWAPFILLVLLPSRKWAVGFLGALVAVNLVFLFAYDGFLEKNRGTRGYYYGSFMVDQAKLFEEICATKESGVIPLDLSAVTVRDYSAQYFARKLPACAGKELVTLKPEAGGPRVKVDYVGESSGGLKWELAP